MYAVAFHNVIHKEDCKRKANRRKTSTNAVPESIVPKPSNSNETGKKN